MAGLIVGRYVFRPLIAGSIAPPFRDSRKKSNSFRNADRNPADGALPIADRLGMIGATSNGLDREVPS